MEEKSIMEQPVSYRVLWNTSYGLVILVTNILTNHYFLTPFIPPLVAELLCRSFYKYHGFSLLMESLLRLRWLILAMAAYHYWYVLPYEYDFQNRQLWGIAVIGETVIACIQFVVCIVVLFAFRKFRKANDRSGIS